jgi:hypothetical protein
VGALAICALATGVPAPGWAQATATTACDSVQAECSAPRQSDRSPLLRTPAEAAEYLSYTSPDEALAWLQELELLAGPVISVRPLVTVPDGAGGRPVVVPVARISDTSRSGKTAQAVGPTSVADRVRVLVFGSQHGDERAGYEVALRLARDLSVGPLSPLLERLEVVIVPVANPIGMRAGTRSDRSGEDPNRDHVTLESPVNRALWEVHAAFEPHLVLDLHEMGPTPFEAQVGLPTHPNVDPGLTELGRYWLLPYVVRALAEANVRFREYISESPDPADRSILEAPADTFFTLAPISASNARNAFSLAGSLGLLLETASQQEIDDLQRRTDRLHLVATSFLEVTAGLSDEVLARVWKTPDHRDAATPFLALRAENEADPSQPYLSWLRRNAKGNLVPLRVHRWRPAVRVTAALPLPAAWVILPRGADLVGHLVHHGIRVERLEESRELEVSEYRSPDTVAPVERTVPAGSFIVRSDQPRQRLLFTLIEPGSDDGWLHSPPPGLARATQEAYSREAGAGAERGDEEASAGFEIPLLRIEGRLPALPLVSADAIQPASGR